VGGLTIVMLGVIAIYLSVIFNEVKSRPYYIIREIYEHNEHQGEGKIRNLDYGN
jgi:hypothetical protein